MNPVPSTGVAARFTGIVQRVTDSFTVRWTQTAGDDLLSITHYVVGRDRPDAAERLHCQITRAALRLGTTPRHAESCLSSREKASMATASRSWVPTVSGSPFAEPMLSF